MQKYYFFSPGFGIRAFSLIELLVSLIIVSLIITALVPVVTKKIKKQALAISSASKVCPNDFLCEGNKKTPCPVGFYCINGEKKPCSDFGAACTSCTSSGCTNKNCSVFGACTNCTPSSCLASGCINGVLNGARCDDCPVGYYCNNGAKISCSTFGTGCTKCTQTACTVCNGGVLSAGKCNPIPPAVDIGCIKFDPYCSSCTQTACTGCSKGYLENGNCNISCNAFGPGCRTCNSTGCALCLNGFARIQTNGKYYCFLDLGGHGSINDAQLQQAVAKNTGIRRFNDISSQKCPDAFTPCCWIHGGKALCNWNGAISVCAALNASVPSYAAMSEFARYFNTYQGDLSLRHILFVENLINREGLCYKGQAGANCELENMKCNYEKDFPYGTCAPFITWAAEPYSYMSFFPDSLGTGGYKQNIAASVVCVR